MCFDSLDDCRKKIDDPEFYSLISDVYTNGGYHLLGMADQGFRVMSTNKPVNSFADFKGQKIRTMETVIILAFSEALRCKPDSNEFQWGLYRSSTAYDRCDEEIHMKLSFQQLIWTAGLCGRDQSSSASDLSDRQWWIFQDLPEDKQAILVEAAEIAKEEARQASDDRIADKIKVNWGQWNTDCYT